MAGFIVDAGVKKPDQPQVARAVIARRRQLRAGSGTVHLCARRVTQKQLDDRPVQVDIERQDRDARPRVMRSGPDRSMIRLGEAPDPDIEFKHRIVERSPPQVVIGGQFGKQRIGILKEMLVEVEILPCAQKKAKEPELQRKPPLRDSAINKSPD